MGRTPGRRCCCAAPETDACRRAVARRAAKQRPTRRSGRAALRDSYLPIQGPPGTGKTFTGAGQILELIAQGRTVGITGPSHAVIHNLIDEVCEHAAERGMRCASVSGPIRTTPICIQTRTDEPRQAERRAPTVNWTWRPAPAGCGPASSSQAASTRCSSTRRARCRWPTSWRWPARPGTSSCWAIPSNSPSRARRRIRRGGRVGAGAHPGRPRDDARRRGAAPGPDLADAPGAVPVTPRRSSTTGS